MVNGVKKIIVLFLAILTVLMLSVPAFAAEGDTDDALTLASFSDSLVSKISMNALATGTSTNNPSGEDTDTVGGSDDAGSVDGADQTQADDTVAESADDGETKEDKGGCGSSVSLGGAALMIIGCAMVTLILKKKASDDRSNAI